MKHGERGLREGFTTGSAATAAAMAAAGLLLGGESAGSVSIPLPPPPDEPGDSNAPGCAGDTLNPPDRARLVIPVSFLRREGEGCAAGVVKDGGDDPDATHGAMIEALVLCHAPASPVSGEAGTMSNPPSAGFVKARPLRREQAQVNCACASRQPVAKEDFGNSLASPVSGEAIAMPGNIFLYGGRGVGRASLPGLPVKAGEAAINPGPRRQIAAGLLECAARFGYCGELHCVIRVPEGEARAKRTLNGRLGIVGGISILGTSGTVKPYSHDAWRSAVSQGMDVARALGFSTICLSTGRRSEKALQALFPELPVQSFIQVADYAGFSLEQAAQHQFNRVVWGCFPGKLLKLAQGLAWTHAKGGEPDFSLLTRLFIAAGIPEGIALETAALPTTQGALDHIRALDPSGETRVLEAMASLAAASMRSMLAAASPSPGSYGPPALLLRVFTPDGVLRVSLDQ